MPLDDFFAGPGRTVLAPGEIVESIDLPLPTERTGGAFGRLTRRHGVDLAIVSVCCVVRESATCDLRSARSARVRSSVDITAGRSARRCAERSASPISDLRGERRLPRRPCCAVLARRALEARRVERLRGAAGDHA